MEPVSVFEDRFFPPTNARQDLPGNPYKLPPDKSFYTKFLPRELYVGPATTQNLIVKFDGEIRGGVSVENASDDFPQQKKLENLLPNFAKSSPPISPKTPPTSLWKSLVLMYASFWMDYLRTPRKKDIVKEARTKKL